ncbi:hypothetical protein KEH51_02490 [[Brevibacterium] frigoritolerans]|uniref:Uncharacterized protein n=1 Tax=Peribacillus frigoritolerans TaxID=450367 RepID=A0A941J9Q8_9BACI|nr:hypothetical protein [Peribacillus frigoritolerans]
MIGAGSAETPAGAAGQVRPHRRLRRGGSPPTKENQHLEGNQPQLTTW